MTRELFVGRHRELMLLERFLEGQGPGIAVIYGRRRIGKSLLIRQALRGRRALIFEGLENRPKRAQLEAFGFQLGLQRREGADLPRARSWMEAFQRLEPFLREGPGCIVLDELQWLANYRRELVSDLKMIWEQRLAKYPGAKLILCGSLASFMTTRVVRSSALYGRTDLELHLKGFELRETKEMLSNRGMDEVMDAALLFGGVPKYLDILRPYGSIREAVEDLAFRATGYFVEEYDRIFTSHFGRNASYEKIIFALATRPEGLFRKELAANAEVVEGGALTELLANLESAGFITSLRPFDRGEGSRLLKLVLSDAYLRFYHAFIRPNLSKIRSGAQRGLFARLSQTGRFHAWRGHAFEHLCQAHSQRIAEILGFGGIDFTVGPFFRAPARQKSGLQIDLMFARADHVITLCEMKCSNAPVGMAVTREVERKVELLGSIFPRMTIQRVLVVHGEPSRELAHSGTFYRIIRSTELAG